MKNDERTQARIVLFHSEIICILQSPTSVGSFEEQHVLGSGEAATYRVGWATGMASSFAQSSYADQFGTIPDWVAGLHPSHRAQLCRLALEAAQPLPAERPEVCSELPPDPELDLGTDDSREDARPANKRSRNPRFAIIQETLRAAAAFEQQISPFRLTGRDYEKRVSVDRQLAQVLRAIDLPHCRLSGYGPTSYYPERVFRRASEQLRKLTGENILVSDHQGTRYYISTP